MPGRIIIKASLFHSERRHAKLMTLDDVLFEFVTYSIVPASRLVSVMRDLIEPKVYYSKACSGVLKG